MDRPSVSALGKRLKRLILSLLLAVNCSASFLNHHSRFKNTLAQSATAMPSHGDNEEPIPLCEIPLEERHAQKVPSFAKFATTAALLPVVSVTVLPLSLAYQTGKYVLEKVLTTTENAVQTKFDSGHVVDPSQRMPREARTFDIVVLGATGFTGGLAARYLAMTYGTSQTKVKWAIAGRSQSKMDQVLAQLAQELGNQELKTMIPTIVVDTSTPSTLPRLVADTRVVATTAGPYSLYGSHVVEFCCKYGTHYVDITGEVDWVRTMMSQWQSVAQETGARLVPFCGHDSIPWDLMVMKLQQLFQKHFANDEMVSVTFWDEFRLGAPGGTLATINAGIEGKLVESPKCEIDPFRQLPNSEKSAYRVRADLPSFIQKSKSPWDSKILLQRAEHRWTVPFILAGINARVVGWSHALRQIGTKRLVYSEMQVVPNFRSAFCSFFETVLFGVTMSNPLTGSLVRQFVLPKSGEGPSMHAMKNKNYLYVTGEGIGREGNRVQVALYFTKDVGCLETARMMVEAGLLLSHQQEKGGENNSGGGFWPPSVALGDALLDKVLDDDTHFSHQLFPAHMVRSKL